MTPRVGDDIHWFAEHGLFDGLFLMKDDETDTYWDHLTGEAVYGPLVGEKLEVEPLLQTTAERALQQDPGALISISNQAIRSDDQMKVEGLFAGIRGRLNGMFASTVEKEDGRRPTMDLGMGLWTDSEARYYPMDVLRAEGRALVDTFAGRDVLIYIDPQNFVPVALGVEGGSPEWDGDVLRLSDGTYIEDGVLYDTRGERVEPTRPLQVFTRWYGFSLTFPETEIYGEDSR